MSRDVVFIARVRSKVRGPNLKPDKRFLKQPKAFWATVRLVSEAVGYTKRKTGRINEPTIHEIAAGLKLRNLEPSHVLTTEEIGNKLGDLLVSYFEFRASTLYDFVRPNLMNESQAKHEFERLKSELNPTCPLPLNKQKGLKKAHAYFTGIINILISESLGGLDADYDPRRLTTVTRDGIPLRTLARRVDGAFPSTVNPVAIWEIKEYYYTTTFGSRVADGVYETLLDGLELEELRDHEGVDVLHYLMVDAYKTWWEDGRSYLCRMVDMLHMGYVDEILFGREVITRLPELVKDWKIRHAG